ncbi:hypothetical protein NQ317_009683 [Molorchus minor]|uniref:Dipeptidylpeptidase IV N-terminal domain-containing protein n=1 Tax=Molorchus minor TaxID=1323400 RepID=A0ABQ9JHA3_9CUCU|nr:hypothetical protein NQ317_009683 [Molorchus minor]
MSKDIATLKTNHLRTYVNDHVDWCFRIFYQVANGTSIQLATFAPAGHGLVYVSENNIYYVEDFAVDVGNPITVTNVGESGVVYCGVPDWVYEGAILIVPAVYYMNE